MNHKLLAAGLCLIEAIALNAAVTSFDLSPAGTDNGIGLSPLNEVSLDNPSTGSGNEILGGISFDDSTLTLSLNIGWGSSEGFSDLTGSITGVHIHSPAGVGENTGVLFNLGNSSISTITFTDAGTAGGRVTGTIQYTAGQAADLFAGLQYVNVHTASNTGGEIRGQLVAVPEPSTWALLALGLAGGWLRLRSRAGAR